jgi:hypothetical protein
MLKTLLAATTALTLMAGAGYAETSYSSTEHATIPSHDVDISKTTRRTADNDGVTIEKNKTVTKDADRDHDRLMLKDKSVTIDADRGRDHDRLMAEKDKTVTKDTSVSANGDVSRKKTESTTIR